MTVSMIRGGLWLMGMLRVLGLILYRLLDVTQWWVVLVVSGSRWRWKKRVVRMRVQAEAARRKWRKERDKRLALEREMLAMRERLDTILEMHMQAGEGRESLVRDLLVWLGRVGAGFGPGDTPPDVAVEELGPPPRLTARTLAAIRTSRTYRRLYEATEQPNQPVSE